MANNLKGTKSWLICGISSHQAQHSSEESIISENLSSSTDRQDWRSRKGHWPGQVSESVWTPPAHLGRTGFTEVSIAYEGCNFTLMRKLYSKNKKSIAVKYYLLNYLYVCMYLIHVASLLVLERWGLKPGSPKGRNACAGIARHTPLRSWDPPPTAQASAATLVSKNPLMYLPLDSLILYISFSCLRFSFHTFIFCFLIIYDVYLVPLFLASLLSY